MVNANGQRCGYCRLPLHGCPPGQAWQFDRFRGSIMGLRLRKRGVAMYVRPQCRVGGLICVSALLVSSHALAGAHTAPKDFEPVPVDKSKELPTRIIPNIPAAAEAYYAPDDYHLIAQTQDPDAQRPEGERVGGALTYIFTDDGKVSKRSNDRGQDACSYFFPDQQRIVWTSTRDNTGMPLGNWSSQDEYPQGSELYTSDLDGNDIVRLTDNEWYEAEVSISPNGEWIVFGRQIDGNLNLWRMRPDGSDEQQITFTEDWQPGAPFYLPDNETILFRAWRASEYGKVRPTPTLPYGRWKGVG